MCACACSKLLIQSASDVLWQWLALPPTLTAGRMLAAGSIAPQCPRPSCRILLQPYVLALHLLMWMILIRSTLLILQFMRQSGSVLVCLACLLLPVMSGSALDGPLMNRENAALPEDEAPDATQNAESDWERAVTIVEVIRDLQVQVHELRAQVHCLQEEVACLRAKDRGLPLEQ